MTKLKLTAADGYPLAVLYAEPVGVTMGVVVISPATGVKKEFYLNFSLYLVNQGYVVLVYDYRGIGESAPERLQDSTAYIHEWGTLDMNAVLNYLVNNQGFTAITWIGHSIGAQLVGFLDKRQHIRKVIAVNAALGYWGYFRFPSNLAVWIMWYLVSPVLTRYYGYGPMNKVGWGQNLPKNAFLQWRRWCLSKQYYRDFLLKEFHMDKFYHFATPITAVYTSDDPIANDTTVPLMMEFFPNAPVRIQKIFVGNYTNHNVGHTGIFRKKFETTLWPLLHHLISE